MKDNIPGNGTIRKCLERIDLSFILCSIKRNIRLSRRSVALNQVIRQAREEAGLTLTDAAARLGIGKSTLSRLENANGPITATRLVELAELYHVSAGSLMDEAVVHRSTEPDYKLVRRVVATVVEVAQSLDHPSSPEKVSQAVVEVLTLSDLLPSNQRDSDFDLDRFRSVIKAMLR